MSSDLTSNRSISNYYYYLYTDYSILNLFIIIDYYFVVVLFMEYSTIEWLTVVNM